MQISPLAGKSAEQNILVSIPKLVTAYYTGIPDTSVTAEKVSFGNSGHRGSSFKKAFNENHILAITQAICLYRKNKKQMGFCFLVLIPMRFLILHTRLLLKCLRQMELEINISEGDEHTPTPSISYAILKYNKGGKTGLADGIIITASHNPPDDGGFKYNPPKGGHAGSDITNWIEKKANELLKFYKAFSNFNSQ